jgi:hypothetical protein
MLSRSLLLGRDASVFLLLAASAACGGELQTPDGGGNAAGSPATGGAGASSDSGGAGQGANNDGGAGEGANNEGGAGEGGASEGGGSVNGPAAVDLGTAGNFVILAKSGIDTVPASVITGDIGVSPIDSTALTGFSLTVDAGGTFALSTQLIGNAYAADFASPTPANLTAAVGDMETAYTDAAGRPTPDFTNLASGELGGLTLVPGLYKWGTGVLISTDVTVAGGPDDVWIFQISGGITEASNVSVTLTGGALPENIFWQTAGAVALDTGAHLEGIVLSQTEITLATGATVNGRLLSQTAVTLNASTVTEP